MRRFASDARRDVAPELLDSVGVEERPNVRRVELNSFAALPFRQVAPPSFDRENEFEPAREGRDVLLRRVDDVPARRVGERLPTGQKRAVDEPRLFCEVASQVFEFVPTPRDRFRKRREDGRFLDDEPNPLFDSEGRDVSTQRRRSARLDAKSRRAADFRRVVRRKIANAPSVPGSRGQRRRDRRQKFVRR